MDQKPEDRGQKSENRYLNYELRITNYEFLFSSIFQSLNSSILNSDSGFTLLELAIVCFIISIVFFITLPRLENIFPSTGLKTSASNLTGMIKQVYSSTAIRHTKMRLNYNLSSGEYWVTYKDEKGIYLEDKSVLVRKKKLARGIRFQDIITLHDGKKVEGQTYTDFVPNGFVEKTIIHLINKKEVISLVVKPLTGSVVIYNKYYQDTVG